MYRSPTCTEYDKRTAEELAAIAGIRVEEFAREMFKAGSNLKDKEPKEIFYQDYKTFSSNDISFGVGQINAMTEEELADIKKKLLPYLKETAESMKVNMIFFMLTNIINETTELLYVGDNAEETIQNAFGVQTDVDSFRLEGVISRKKQLIPALMASMQQ